MYPRCLCWRRDRELVQYVCPSSQRMVASCGLNHNKSVEEICCKDVEEISEIKESKERIRNRREAGVEEGKKQESRKEVQHDNSKNNHQDKHQRK